MDDYDSIFAGIAQKRQSSAQATVTGVSGINPESAAMAVQTAPKLGVHPDAIIADPGAAADMAKADSASTILTANPQVARWAAGAPAKVAATQDDFENLHLMSRAYDALGAFAHHAVTGDLAKQGLTEAGTEYIGSMENAWGQLKQDYLSSIPQAEQYDGHGFWDQTKAQFSQQLSAGKTIVDAFNLAISPLTGAIGMVTGAIDRDVHGVIPSTTPGILKAALDQGLMGIRPKAGLSEFGPIPKAAPSGADAFTGAYASAIGVPRLLSPEAQAAYDASKLKAAEDAVAASKTQARSTELTKEFLGQHDAKSVFVPAQTLIDAEMADPASVKPLADGVPGYQNKVIEAASRGGDVEIPANEYLASVSGTPIAETLRDNARIDDGLSVEEAKAFSTTPGDIAREHEGDVNQLFTEALGNAAKATEPNIEEARLAEVKAAAKAALLEAKNSQYLRQLFPDAKTAGMTEPQFAAYAKAVQASQEAIQEKLIGLVQKQLTREQSVEWKDATKTMRAAVEGDLYNRPNIRARSLILHGELPNGEAAATGPIRLDRRVAESQYKPDLLTRLPKNTFGANGVGADDVAEFLGFNSGEELLKALANLEDARKASGATGAKQHLEQMVKEETQRKVRAKLGNLISPEGIAAEARRQVTSPEAFGFLHDEMKALAAQAQLSPLTKGAIEALAEQNFAKLVVKEALTGTREFARASRKNGEEAERLLIKGKFAEAFKAKQNQIMNQLLLREANAFQSEFRKAIARAKRWAGEVTIKSIDQEYLNYIHEALGELGFRVARNPQELLNQLDGVARSEFISRKNSEGFNIVEATVPGQPETIHVHEFRGVVDMLDSLAHNGRMVQTIKVGIDRMEFDAAIAEAQAQFDGIGKRFTRDQMDFDSTKKRLGHLGRGIDASFLRMETIADLMDSFDPNGIFNRVAIRPTQEAKHLVDDLEDEVKKSLKDFAETVPKDFGNDFDTRVDLPYLRGRIPGNVDSADADEPIFTKKSHVIALALNLGNAGNKAKALGGYGLTEAEAAHATTTYLKEEDWKFVQKLWDEFDKLWPRIAELYRNLSGVAPPKVEPSPVRTPYGTYRGGYWPVMYDPFMKPEAGGRAASSIYDPSHFSALPPNPYTKGRTNYVAPIHLNMDIFAERIGQIIHDLAYREALLNAQKFLLHPKILKGVAQTFGPEYADQMRPWLEHLANARTFDDKSTEVLSNIMSRTRQGVVMVGLGYRISTALMHGPTALALSMGEVGAKPFAQALFDIHKTPTETVRMYRELQAESGELRHRVLNMDVNIREQYKKLYEKQGFVTLLQHYAFHMVAASDMFSAVPTYLAAKRLAIQDNPGISDADAIALADKRLRLAHGASAPPDVPAVMRDKALRWFTPFMTFMNTMYNRDRLTVRMGNLAGKKMGEGDYAGAKRDWTHIVARLFYGVVATSIIHDIVKGSGKDKKGWLHEFADGIVYRLAAPIPIVRDIVGAATTGYDFEASPLSSAGKEVIQTGKDILHEASGQHVSARWVQHAFESIGYIAMLPLGQAGTTAQYIHDYATGRERPKDFGEYLHGLVFGRSK